MRIGDDHRKAAAHMGSWVGRLAAAVAIVVAAAAGCSNGEVVGGKGNSMAEGGVPSEAGGSSGASSSGAGSSGGDDAGSGDDSSTDVQTMVGTTGKACSSDSDCTSPDNDTCSIDYVYTLAGVTGLALPASVCIENPTSDNCDPAPADDPFGQAPHFCDGPDDPSSPGFCLADNPNNPQSGMGTCLPKCTFSTNGAAAVGCTAPDTCTPWIYAGSGNSIVGFGFCQGTCQKDSDCGPQQGVPATCQTDVGICTTQPVTRTLMLGDACTYDDYQSGACNCNVDPTSLTGFCTTVCVVGGTPCPTGWVCDTAEPTSVTVGATTIPITVQNPGLAGICLPSCPMSQATQGVAIFVDGGAGDAESTGTEADGQAALDAAAASDAGDGASFQCPAGSTCTLGTVAAPDCVP
jgi:hypothetical protein